MEDDKTYVVEFDYDTDMYSAAAMDKFAAIFDEIVLALQDENKMISEILKG